MLQLCWISNTLSVWQSVEFNRCNRTIFWDVLVTVALCSVHEMSDEPSSCNVLSGTKVLKTTIMTVSTNKTLATSIASVL